MPLHSIKVLFFATLFSTSLYAQESKLDFNDQGLLANTEVPKMYANKDTITFEYQSITVRKVNNNKGDAGQWIQLTNKRNSIELTDEAAYFIGVVGNVVLIDIGTSNVRDIKAYDVQSMNEAFSYTYYGALQLKGSMLKFKTDPEDENTSFQCKSEDDIPVQQISINTKTQKAIYSTKIDCIYAE